MGTNGAKNPVQSIERTCRLLQLLKTADGARIAELANQVELSEGSIHSHLATLEMFGLVSNEGGVYRLGLDCLTLGGYVRDRHPLYVAGRDGVDELAAETGELVAMTTEGNGKSVYLYQTFGDRAMSIDSHLGVQLPLHCTAAGKAILSELPTDRVEEILDAHGLPAWTERTITDREELFADLEGTRERGVSFDDEERIEGLRAIGAPVVREGSVLGAIAIAGPVTRMDGEYYKEELPNRLQKIRRMIEVAATYPQR